MKKWWFNSMLFKKELERRCRLNKSMDSLGPIENTSEIEDSNRKDTTKNIQSWGGRDDSSYSNVDRLFDVKDIRNFIPYETFLVKDSNGDIYSIYFDIENQIFEIDNNHSFYSYCNSSYPHNGSTSEDTCYRYMYDTQYSWINYINSCINNFLQSQIRIDTSMVSDSDNCSDSYIDSYIYGSFCGESQNNGEREHSGIRTRVQGSDLTLRESSNDIDVTQNDIDVTQNDIGGTQNNIGRTQNNIGGTQNNIGRTQNNIGGTQNNIVDTQKYKHLWVLCENCYGLNYKRFLKEKMNICEQCGYHLKMSSSDRIELSIDPGTWHPMDEDMVFLDPIEWDSEEQPYIDSEEQPYIDIDSEEQPYIDIDSEQPIEQPYINPEEQPIEEPYINPEEQPIEEPYIEEPYTDSEEEDYIEIEEEDEPYIEQPYKDSEEEPYKDSEEEPYSEEYSYLEIIEIKKPFIKLKRSYIKKEFPYINNFIKKMNKRFPYINPEEQPIEEPYIDINPEQPIEEPYINPEEQPIEEPYINPEEQPIEEPYIEELYINPEEQPYIDIINIDSEEQPIEEPYIEEPYIDSEQPIEQPYIDSEEQPYIDIEEQPYIDIDSEQPIEQPYIDSEEQPIEEPYINPEEQPIEEPYKEEPYKDSEEQPYIDSEEEDEPYIDRIYYYQRETGLTEAVQTGIGQLNGIPVAVGVMDFQFIGGSMGSAVGEKITRLIEYATKEFLPLIIVCASGGARMQEGSLSLMQMAKISSALYDYQSNKKLFYVSILTSPTTGGVTASFGMLGDIIIAEPNASIAFAGKRVIEQTLNIKVPEGVQEAENLFHKGLFDLIVPRNLLKNVLTELFKLHALFPLTKN